MADMMTFPNTWEEYEEIYGITDTEQIYTNGSRLIPSFRVKQWLDHLESEQNTADTPQTETQTETQNSNLTFEKQTDCETCKFYDPDHEAIACERCLDGKYNRYEPQMEAVVKPYKPTNREILDAIENSDCPWK